MEGLFGGLPAQSATQGQDDVFGLAKVEGQQTSPAVQPGIQQIQSQPASRQQPQIPGQMPHTLSGQQMQVQQPGQQQPPVQQEQNQHLQQVPIPQTREHILSTIQQIGQQMGKRVDLTKVNSMSDYELQQQYFEVLKEAQPAEQSQQQIPSEMERLQKQNEEMGKLLAQFMGMNQQPLPQQMPQVSGQYTQNPQVTPQQFQQMQSQQPIQQQLQLPQIDSEEFYAKLEENPSKAIAEVATPLVQNALTQQAQQFQQYLQQMREQQQREQQTQHFYTQQIDYLKRTHPDFDQYRYVAAQVLNERPYYAMIENGLVYAYEEAKQRVQSFNQQQLQQQQPVNYQQMLQKQVAGMPGTVNYFQGPQPQNPFGTVTKKGIFG